MLEIMWALSNTNAYEWARWAPDDKQNVQLIKVEKIQTSQLNRNQFLSNMIANTRNTVISTRHQNDYKPGQQIFYRKKWWLIENVVEDEQELNPQMAMLLAKPLCEYYFELLEQV